MANTPAMHDEVYNAMELSIFHRRDLMVGTLKFEMTHDECLQLVAPPGDIDLLKRAADVAQLSAADDWMYVDVPDMLDGCSFPQVALMMRTHEQKIPPLRPRVPKWRGHDHGKVTTWLEQRLIIGRRFGTARHVLNWLRNNCDTGHQVRYMFPAVMHLCSHAHNERLDKWIDKYGAYRPCRHTPAVSPELKRAIQGSAALLTASVLMGDDVAQETAGFVSIDAYDLPSFEIEGVRVRRV